jgi:hypothetical protein
MKRYFINLLTFSGYAIIAVIAINCIHFKAEISHDIPTRVCIVHEFHKYNPMEIQARIEHNVPYAIQLR